MFSIVETASNTINNGIIAIITNPEEFKTIIKNKLHNDIYTEISTNINISDITRQSKYPNNNYLFIGIKNAYYFKKFIHDGMNKSDLLYYWTMISNDIYNPSHKYYISENNTKMISHIENPTEFIEHIQNKLLIHKYTIIHNTIPSNILEPGKYLVCHNDIIVFYEKGPNISRTHNFWCLYKNNISI